MLGLGTTAASHTIDLFKNQWYLDCDGTNDYVDTGLTHQETLRGSYSIGMWIKPDDGRPAAADYLVGGLESGNTDALLIQLKTTGKISVGFKADGDPLTVTTDSAVFADGAISDWMHLLVVVNLTGSNSTITIYTNGTEEASSVIGGQALSAANHVAYTCNDNIFLAAANNNGSATNHFAGEIDEFAIWNIALDANAAAVVGAKVIDLQIPSGAYVYNYAKFLQQYIRFEGSNILGINPTTFTEPVSGATVTVQNGGAYAEGGPSI
jgi:hypothetical protein